MGQFRILLNRRSTFWEEMMMLMTIRRPFGRFAAPRLLKSFYSKPVPNFVSIDSYLKNLWPKDNLTSIYLSRSGAQQEFEMNEDGSSANSTWMKWVHRQDGSSVQDFYSKTIQGHSKKQLFLMPFRKLHKLHQLFPNFRVRRYEVSGECLYLFNPASFPQFILCMTKNCGIQLKLSARLKWNLM